MITDAETNLDYLTSLNRILYRRDKAESISANPQVKEGSGFLNLSWNYELAFRHYSGFFDDCILPQIKKENLIYKK